MHQKQLTFNLAIFCTFLPFFCTAFSADYVLVPGSLLVHRSCLYAVPSGTHLFRTGEITTVRYPNDSSTQISSCPHPKFRLKPLAGLDADPDLPKNDAANGFNGYLYSAFPQREDTMVSWSGRWSVPDPAINPTISGYSFWWIGTVNNFWGPNYQVNVFQPVLLYSENGAPFGVGNFSYACWFAGDNYYYTEQLPVQSQETIVAALTKNTENPNSWRCTMQTLERSDSSVSLNVYGNGVAAENAAIIGVEAYAVGGCSELPVPSNGCFEVDQLQLKLSSGATVRPLQWTERPSRACGMTSSISDTSVKLCYNNHDES